MKKPAQILARATRKALAAVSEASGVVPVCSISHDEIKRLGEARYIYDLAWDILDAAQTALEVEE
jgi:hypothetical protein